jgi:hypothetical protein
MNFMIVNKREREKWELINSTLVFFIHFISCYAKYDCCWWRREEGWKHELQKLREARNEKSSWIRFLWWSGETSLWKKQSFGRTLEWMISHKCWKYKNLISGYDDFECFENRDLSEGRFKKFQIQNLSYLPNSLLIHNSVNLTECWIWFITWFHDGDMKFSEVSHFGRKKYLHEH